MILQVCFFLPPWASTLEPKKDRRSQKNIEFQSNDTKMYVHRVKKIRDKWEIWHFLKEDQVTLVYLLSEVQSEL